MVGACASINADHIAGDYIRQLRRLVGWSQFHVSKATLIDRTRISLAECDHITLRPDEVHLIEQAVRMAARERVAHFERVLAAPTVAPSVPAEPAAAEHHHDGGGDHHG